MGQAWLIIERADNWEVDATNGFSFFGLSDRYRKMAAEVAEGDLLICYVSSGRSAFADMRRVKEAGLKRLKVQSYDAAFAFCFATVPVLVLPREKWVPMKTIAEELDLTRGLANYNALLQTSIRKLSQHDSAFLQKKLQNAFEEAWPVKSRSSAMPDHQSKVLRPKPRRPGKEPKL